MPNYFKFAIILILCLIVLQTAKAETLFNDSNNKLRYSEIDRFKCYNDTSKTFFEPEVFNATAFYYRLIRMFNSSSYNTHNYSVKRYDLENEWYLPPRVIFIENEKGQTFRFETDGRWWVFTYEKSMSLANSENYAAIPQFLDETKENFRQLLTIVGRTIDHHLNEDLKIETNYCIMGAESNGYSVGLSILNLKLGEGYMNQTGCQFEKGAITLDCKNSKIINYIPEGNHWRKKNHATRIDYQYNNNFIILDKTDINYPEREGYFYTFGQAIVLSESDFVGGLSGGQTAYVQQLEFLRYLVEFHNNATIIEKTNTEVLNSTNTLLLVISEIDKLAGNETISAKEKKSRLNYFNDIDTVPTIQAGRDVLLNHQKQYLEMQSFISDTVNTYFGDYYSELSRKYLANYAGSLATLKDNLEYYNIKDEFFKTYKTQVELMLESEISRQENQEESNNNIFLTLLLSLIPILLATTTFFVENIIKRYGNWAWRILFRVKYLKWLGLVISFVIIIGHSSSIEWFLLTAIIINVIQFYVFIICILAVVKPVWLVNECFEMVCNSLDQKAGAYIFVDMLKSNDIQFKKLAFDKIVKFFDDLLKAKLRDKNIENDLIPNILILLNEQKDKKYLVEKDYKELEQISDKLIKPEPKEKSRITKEGALIKAKERHRR